MNLSKIAVGLAVSLCVASNVALADEKKELSTEATVTQQKNDAKELTLLEKAENKQKESYEPGNVASILEDARKKVKEESAKILESIRKEQEQNGRSMGPVPPKRPVQKVTYKKKDQKKDIILPRQEAEEIIEQVIWESVWDKLSDSDKLAIQKTLGYAFAHDELDYWSKSGDGLDTAHYYLLDILNEDVNNALYSARMNKKATTDSKDEIKKDLSDVTKLISLNKKDINDNKKLIAGNKEAIAANKAEIDTYNKYVIENNNKIAYNQKAIQTINQQLSDLNKSVKNGLATQSALNGLFQPYNIGKMNVSAALGGYKSHNALAVGAGFRFNKNVAAKAGISSSFDGSALSYNMGVNYEF
ncbi:ubiquitous surface protein A2H [Pasteurella multocida subsp. multocida OH4807]|nr:ubiquitous surface protein A2H [Pasteurella multocida subsp. multocida OH4807]